MSVFNGEAFLAQAIESILNQSFGDFEFLVIDDGSTDASPKIISDYASRDKRIRALRHDNKGRAESLNIGVRLASGEYIARMDADDVALPRRLEKQIEFMEQNPDVGVLGGAYELINASGHVINNVRPPLRDPEIRSLMLSYNPMCHPTVVMRKDIVLSSGGYRAALLDADDYDLFLRMGDRSELANLGEPILQYRIHANQVSVRNMRHQTLCVLAARSAASLRRSGRADPLCEVTEVTPQLLNALGVPMEEIHNTLAGVYSYWIDTLGRSDPEGSLRLIDGLMQLSSSGCVKRQVLADAVWKAAGIHYRSGRLVKAFLSAGHAAFMSPIVAQRFMKWPFRRIITAFRDESEPLGPSS